MQGAQGCQECDEETISGGIGDGRTGFGFGIKISKFCAAAGEEEALCVTLPAGCIAATLRDPATGESVPCWFEVGDEEKIRRLAAQADLDIVGTQAAGR